jgi:hypothetical protein
MTTTPRTKLAMAQKIYLAEIKNSQEDIIQKCRLSTPNILIMAVMWILKKSDLGCFRKHDWTGEKVYQSLCCVMADSIFAKNQFKFRQLSLPMMGETVYLPNQ